MNAPDILNSIHQMAPVDTKFVAGRWHHDRATLKGIQLEARVFLKSLITPTNTNQRFLIIGRARSGTTLLTKMLNGHSAITSDGEVLKRYMLDPTGYFHRLAGKSGAAAYGAKLLSYQMVQVHRMRQPDRFLRNLSKSGVLLIHLQRDTFFQTLSLAVAQQRRQFHSHKGARAPREKVMLDPQDFLKRVLWSEALLAYEHAAFAGLEHVKISYEHDLADASAQAATLNEISSRLGLAAEPIVASLNKVLPADPSQIVENYLEIRAVLESGDCGHLLPST